MAWVVLVIAGLFEVVWATPMRLVAAALIVAGLVLMKLAT
jgi:multidrug transporter EmrE-like cation transporter